MKRTPPLRGYKREVRRYSILMDYWHRIFAMTKIIPRDIQNLVSLFTIIKGGAVYSIGDNTNQLGGIESGDKLNVLTKLKWANTNEMVDFQISSVAVSGMVSAWLSDHGDVYFVRSGAKKKLTVPDGTPSFRTLSRGNNYEAIVMIDDEGDVFSFGNPDSARRGVPEKEIGTLEYERLSPVLPFYGGAIKVMGAACGDAFGAVLTDDGGIWLWGNIRGMEDPLYSAREAKQFGMKNRRGSSSPIIREIDAGTDFLACLSERGNLWMIGEGFIANHFKEEERTLESLDNAAYLVRPEFLGKNGERSSKEETPLKAISCGNAFMLVLSRGSHNVFSIGSNGNGQCGIPGGTLAKGFTMIPDLVSEDIVSIRTGYMHSMAMNRDKEWWAWGENHSGSVSVLRNGPGSEDEGNYEQPVKLNSLNEDKENIIDVICGFSLTQIIKYH